MMERVKTGLDLELDGGIDPETAPLGVAAGVSVLVADTSVFGDRNAVAAGLQLLRAAIAHAVD